MWLTSPQPRHQAPSNNELNFSVDLFLNMDLVNIRLGALEKLPFVIPTLFGIFLPVMNYQIVLPMLSSKVRK